MAAVMNVLKRSLNVSISRGQDADGNPVSKTYTYSNVKPDAEPAKMLAAGKARSYRLCSGRTFFPDGRIRLR